MELSQQESQRLTADLSGDQDGSKTNTTQDTHDGDDDDDDDNGAQREFHAWKKRHAASVGLIIILYFTSGTVYSLPAAFYSPFVVNEKQGSVIQVSLVLSSFDISNMLVSVFYPLLMLGFNSKNIFHVGCLILCVTNALFGLVMQITMGKTLYLFLSTFLRTIMGIGCALLCCAGAELMASLAPGNLNVGFISWAISATWLGDMLGPLIGGLLEETTNAFPAPFVIISALILISQVMLAFTIEKRILNDKFTNLAISWNSWYKFTTQVDTLMAVSVTFLIAVGMGSLEVDLALFLLNQYHLDQVTIALIFGAMPLMFAVVIPFSSFMNEYPYALAMLACSVFFFSPGFGFLTISPNGADEETKVVIVIICVCLIGIGAAFGQSPFFPFTLYMAKEFGFTDSTELRLKIASLNNTAYAVGRIIGTVLLGGLFTEYVNFEGSTEFVCFLYASTYLFFLLLKGTVHKIKSQNEPDKSLEKQPLKLNSVQRNQNYSKADLGRHL